MDEKISLDAIANYGDAYAEKVLEEFFSKKEKITGQEILSLCNVQQVNFFIIRELFKAWKEENARQKSAYFNYESEEVKEAMATFMAVLSNNIFIDRSHFTPLLKKAVGQSLLVIFDPYDFYSMLISGEDNRLTVEKFKEEIKYLKVNKAPLERLLQKLQEKNIKEIQGNEAFGILDQILEEVNFTPEDVDQYIESFSTIHPLNPESFYISSGESRKPVVEERVEIQETKRTVHEEDGLVTKESHVVMEQKTIITEKTVDATLHDRISSTKQPALADNYRKIARIKDSLTINQKFMFTKVLFYGDFESFSRAIDELDQLRDMNEALHYLEGHSASWDKESKEFHEFMELVEKRFS